MDHFSWLFAKTDGASPQSQPSSNAHVVDPTPVATEFTVLPRKRAPVATPPALAGGQDRFAAVAPASKFISGVESANKAATSAAAADSDPSQVSRGPSTIFARTATASASTAATPITAEPLKKAVVQQQSQQQQVIKPKDSTLPTQTQTSSLPPPPQPQQPSPASVSVKVAGLPVFGGAGSNLGSKKAKEEFPQQSVTSLSPAPSAPLSSAAAAAHPPISVTPATTDSSASAKRKPAAVSIAATGDEPTSSISARTATKTDFGSNVEQPTSVASQKALAALAFPTVGVMDMTSSFAPPAAMPMRQTSTSSAASTGALQQPNRAQAAAAATAATAAATANFKPSASSSSEKKMGENEFVGAFSAGGSSMLVPSFAQPFVPGSAAALRAQRCAVSIGFSGEFSGSLVSIDGRAWVVTSSEAVFDSQSLTYFKLGQLAVRSPCIPKHFVPVGLFVCSNSTDPSHHSVALLRLGANEQFDSMLLALCVKLSSKVCGLHTTLRGFQVEVPRSRRIFDEEHIYGTSSVSAICCTIVQMRSEFVWRALPDVAVSCNAVAGAALFDEVGDVVAIMVGTGSMLTATSYHQRWDSERGVLAPDTNSQFLHRDYQTMTLKNRAFTANQNSGGESSLAAAAKGRGGVGGDSSALLAPEFVDRSLEWNEVTLCTLECALAFDELINSAAHAVLNRASSSGPGAAAAATKKGVQRLQPASSNPFQQRQSQMHGVSETDDSGAREHELDNVELRPQPSGAAMAMSTMLPRMMRMGTQPVSWVFLHAREAASRLAEVSAGSVKVAHSALHE